MPLVTISGCSGGGKSTLLAELARRGYRTVDEPGRRIVRRELASGGSALPWIDPVAFLEQAVAVASADHAACSSAAGWSFCDRGIVDAASALQDLTGRPALVELGHRFRYHSQVFLTPPWPEIYSQDAERRHGLEDAEAEYGRLCRDFPALGYEAIVLPRVSVADRAELVLETLGPPPVPLRH